MVKPDIHTLAHHLKQERLYVASEKQLIQRLNNDVLKTAERLYRAAWIAKQQRINLDRLILTRSDRIWNKCLGLHCFAALFCLGVTEAERSSRMFHLVAEVVTRQMRSASTVQTPFVMMC